MANSLRNFALHLSVPVLCLLIALNAYLVFNNLKIIRNNAAQRWQASEMQANISRISFELQGMESAQRGYLITGDSSYLAPYDHAKETLAADLATLRSKLAQPDRPRVTQLASLADSMITEMEETLRLRKRDYRHRAFLIVASNHGKQLMEQARATLDLMSSQQAAKITEYDRQMKGELGRAARESALASFVLLLATVVVFVSFNKYRQRLEVRCATHAEQLRVTSLQLEQFASTIFHDFRARIEQIRAQASTLIDVYGGFLPHQGQEKAERIDDGAGQMISLLDDLSRNSQPPNAVPPCRVLVPHEPERLTVQ